MLNPNHHTGRRRRCEEIQVAISVAELALWDAMDDAERIQTVEAGVDCGEAPIKARKLLL